MKVARYWAHEAAYLADTDGELQEATAWGWSENNID